MICKVNLSDDGTPPEWIELFPPGKVDTLDGRKFNNANPAAVVKAFNQVDLELPIDLEHSTQIRGPKGLSAPAMGWMTELEIREGSIWARVRWTEQGAAFIATKEYRYISPAFKVSEKGFVDKIVSAGLTNKPALEQLAAVAHEQQGKGAEAMNPELLAALGLPATASTAEVIAAVQALRASGQKMATDLASVRGELATSQTELASARGADPSLEKFVPRADHDAVKVELASAQTELATQKKTTLDNEIAGVIGAALKAGKITPATKDYYAAQCAGEGGLEMFKKFIEAAPVIGPPSNLDKKPAGGGTVTLTEDQKKIAAQCGISEEDFIAAL